MAQSHPELNFSFQPLNIPNVTMAPVLFPDDIPVQLPTTELAPELQHFLLEIPWNDKYLEYVPSDLRSFFEFVLAYLHTRTTDVHTAICLQYLDEFVEQAFPGQPVNRRVVGLALITHDSGWSELSQAEVAASLGVTGLKLTEGSLGPKLEHAIKGEKLARKLLGDFQDQVGFEPALTTAELELISKGVLYHDRPEEVAGMGNAVPLEIQLLVDLDHIWSFTHFNFWQDTLRKGVSPRTYLENLGKDLPSYFVTEYGKAKAGALLAERQLEVEAWEAAQR